MADIKELAISYWRMDKWLNNANVERKMAASSALRSIKKYLDANGIEVLDLTGQKFDSGLAVDVINNDIPEGGSDENALISEMIKPIVMQNGSVIQFGQVSVGLTVKKQSENNPVKENTTEKSSTNDKVILEEIGRISKLLEEKPSSKWKIVIYAVSVILAILMISNIFIMRSYKNELSKEFDESISKIQIEEFPKEDIDEIKGDINTINNDLDEIKKAIEAQSEKIDELINKYNEEHSKDEIKFTKYTVQKGDNLYTICKNNGIDFNSNITLIQSINSIENVSKIYVGQVLILPTTTTEDN